MRRILIAAAMSVGVLAATACQPTPPTITATPSTLRPACKEVTTVSGKATPAGVLKQVVIEVQKVDGTWQPWKWFPTGASGEPMQVIAKSIKLDGTYSLTYAPPIASSPTTRLRIRGTKSPSDPGVVSKSWYVSRPPSCT